MPRRLHDRLRGAGEMAQQMKALAALLGVPRGDISSSSPRGSDAYLQPLQASDTHMVHKPRSRQA